MISCVIFDVDGTLLDTSEGIAESVRHTVRQLSLKEISRETVLKFIGPPVQESFKKYCSLGDAQAREAAGVFRDYYKEHALFRARPYEGIFELLELLKNSGCRIGAATYKREDYAVRLLEHFSFERYAGVIHGSDGCGVLSKADIIRKCMDELGEDREKCVAAGDTRHDAAGAESAGIGFIAVTYGFGFRSGSDIEDYPCLGVAGRPLDIWDILCREARYGRRERG